MSHAYQPQQPQQPHQPQQQGQPYPPHAYAQPGPPPGYAVQPYGAAPYPGRPAPTAPPKSPGVALILSALIPGLGHLYTGNPISAVIWFVAAIAAAATLTIFIGFLLLPCVWIGALIHAYISAANFNRRHNTVR